MFIKKWLLEKSYICDADASDLEEIMSNGYLIAKILHNEGKISQDEFSGVKDSNNPDNIILNFAIIKLGCANLHFALSNHLIQEVNLKKRGAALELVMIINKSLQGQSVARATFIGRQYYVKHLNDNSKEIKPEFDRFLDDAANETTRPGATNRNLDMMLHLRTFIEREARIRNVEMTVDPRLLEFEGKTKTRQIGDRTAIATTQRHAHETNAKGSINWIRNSAEKDCRQARDVNFELSIEKRGKVAQINSNSLMEQEATDSINLFNKQLDGMGLSDAKNTDIARGPDHESKSAFGKRLAVATDANLLIISKQSKDYTNDVSKRLNDRKDTKRLARLQKMNDDTIVSSHDNGSKTSVVVTAELEQKAAASYDSDDDADNVHKTDDDEPGIRDFLTEFEVRREEVEARMETERSNIIALREDAKKNIQALHHNISFQVSNEILDLALLMLGRSDRQKSQLTSAFGKGSESVRVIANQISEFENRKKSSVDPEVYLYGNLLNSEVSRNNLKIDEHKSIPSVLPNLIDGLKLCKSLVAALNEKQVMPYNPFGCHQYEESLNVGTAASIASMLKKCCCTSLFCKDVSGVIELLSNTCNSPNAMVSHHVLDPNDCVEFAILCWSRRRWTEDAVSELPGISPSKRNTSSRLQNLLPISTSSNLPSLIKPSAYVRYPAAEVCVELCSYKTNSPMDIGVSVTATMNDGSLELLYGTLEQRLAMTGLRILLFEGWNTSEVGLLATMTDECDMLVSECFALCFMMSMLSSLMAKKDGPCSFFMLNFPSNKVQAAIFNDLVYNMSNGEKGGIPSMLFQWQFNILDEAVSSIEKKEADCKSIATSYSESVEAAKLTVTKSKSKDKLPTLDENWIDGSCTRFDYLRPAKIQSNGKFSADLQWNYESVRNDVDGQVQTWQQGLHESIITKLGVTAVKTKAAPKLTRTTSAVTPTNSSPAKWGAIDHVIIISDEGKAGELSQGGESGISQISTGSVDRVIEYSSFFKMSNGIFDYFSTEKSSIEAATDQLDPLTQIIASSKRKAFEIIRAASFLPVVTFIETGKAFSMIEQACISTILVEDKLFSPIRSIISPSLTLFGCIQSEIIRCMSNVTPCQRLARHSANSNNNSFFELLDGFFSLYDKMTEESDICFILGSSENKVVQYATNFLSKACKIRKAMTSLPENWGEKCDEAKANLLHLVSEGATDTKTSRRKTRELVDWNTSIRLNRTAICDCCDAKHRNGLNLLAEFAKELTNTISGERFETEVTVTVTTAEVISRMMVENANVMNFMQSMDSYIGEVSTLTQSQKYDWKFPLLNTSKPDNLSRKDLREIAVKTFEELSNSKAMILSEIESIRSVGTNISHLERLSSAIQECLSSYFDIVTARRLSCPFLRTMEMEWYNAYHLVAIKKLILRRSQVLKGIEASACNVVDDLDQLSASSLKWEHETVLNRFKMMETDNNNIMPIMTELNNLLFPAMSRQFESSVVYKDSEDKIQVVDTEGPKRHLSPIELSDLEVSIQDCRTIISQLSCFPDVIPISQIAQAASSISNKGNLDMWTSVLTRINKFESSNWRRVLCLLSMSCAPSIPSLSYVMALAVRFRNILGTSLKSVVDVSPNDLLSLMEFWNRDIESEEISSCLVAAFTSTTDGKSSSSHVQLLLSICIADSRISRLSYDITENRIITMSGWYKMWWVLCILASKADVAKRSNEDVSRVLRRGYGEGWVNMHSPIPVDVIGHDWVADSNNPGSLCPLLRREYYSVAMLLVDKVLATTLTSRIASSSKESVDFQEFSDLIQEERDLTLSTNLLLDQGIDSF